MTHRRPARRLLALCAAVAALCGVLATPAAAASDPNGAPAEHVVFVGFPGLMWSDVTESGTPNLAALTDHASSAALSVRTVEMTTCPTDGWLTVGAGARATDRRVGDACAAVPGPVVAADGALTVPDLPRVAKHNDKYSYDPNLGAVAAAMAADGRCVTAVGPGAAVATADATGHSPAGYLPDAAALDRAAIARCALTLVDLGPTANASDTARTPETGKASRNVDPSGATRADRLSAFDTALGRIRTELPPHTRLVVAGVADDGPTSHLRLITASGPDAHFGSGLLTATSTRHDGMVQLTDVAPSLLAPFGIDAPTDMVGAVMTRVGGPSGTDAVHDLALLDVGAQAARTVRESYQFLTWLTLVPIVVFAGGILWSRRLGRNAASAARRRGLYRVLQVVAVAAASVPGATFLVGLFPWTEAAGPEGAMIGISLGCAAVLTAVAFAGPWRRHPYGPAGFVAAVTTAILAGDAVTGSHLQMNAIFGLSPLIAGRFYGFGNVAWSVYGMVVLFAVGPLGGMLAAAGDGDRARPEAAVGADSPGGDDGRGRDGGGVADAGRIRRRVSRRMSVSLFVACGLVAIVVNGWPAFGSDFGGVLALVPGFAVLGLLLAGVRISWAKAGLVALGAIAAVTVIAVVDWTRPAQSRSHLGKFVQQVIDGEAGAVLRRKITDNLGSFDTPISFLIPVVMALVLVALLAPPRLRATALPPAYERVHWLRPVLIACWVTAVVGYAVNDSGIQIPSVALLIAVPLGAAVLAAVAAENAAGSGGDGIGGAPPRAQAEPQGAE